MLWEHVVWVQLPALRLGILVRGEGAFSPSSNLGAPKIKVINSLIFKFMQFVQGWEQFLAQNNWILVLLTVWVLPWKGWALWKAAKTSSKKWFIAILILNTLAILDILYIFVFSKKSSKLTG